MKLDEVRFRLLRSDEVPATNPFNLAYRFGLQNTKQNIVEGVRLSDGALAFDFTLRVKQAKDPARPVFTAVRQWPRRGSFCLLVMVGNRSGRLHQPREGPSGNNRLEDG